MGDELNNWGVGSAERVDAVGDGFSAGVGSEFETKSVKKQLGWKIATGVLALLVVVLGGLLVWRMVAKDDSVKCQDVASGDAGNSDGAAGDLSKQDAQVREIVEAVKEVAAQFMKVTLENEFVGSYQVSLDFYREYNEAFPVYKIEESMPFIMLNRSYGFGLFAPTFQNFFTDQRLMEVLRNEEYQAAVEDLFVAKGFESYAFGMEYLNRETGVVCNLPYGGVPTHFACGHIDWYDRENAELVKELGKAYGDVESMVFGEANVVNSEYEPYQRAEVGVWSVAGIGGANGLFYRPGAEAAWQYYAALQTVPSCESFDTEDLRRAFAGVACFSDQSGQEATVEP